MTTTYGMSHETWLAAIAEIRAILRESARQQSLITYGEVTGQMESVRAHPGSYVFTAMLQAACREEEDETGVQPCALVVSKATRRPGAGYFRTLLCADNLDDCWQAEIEAVYQYYANE
jgi:hypothetical protein